MIATTSATDMLAALSEAGFRITEPRKAVVEAILGHGERAFTADDVITELAIVAPGVGRATVFRTLDLLTQRGLLDRLHRPDGCHTYLVCGAVDRHHHHLICSDCGVVVEFEDCDIEPLLQHLQSSTNFLIEGHWLEVFGSCPDCRG